MLRIALTYGGIAGAIVIASIVGGIALSADQGGGHGGASQLLGYLIMLVALSLIFAGVKRLRDKDLGGVIGFVPALLCGLAISGVAGVIYVVVWEAYLAMTDHAFIADYAAAAIEAKREAGASAEAIAKTTAEMKKMKASYANPLYRIPITFLEIFPVGVVISLVSAGLLRNRNFLPARG